MKLNVLPRPPPSLRSFAERTSPLSLSLLPVSLSLAFSLLVRRNAARKMRLIAESLALPEREPRLT